MVSRLSLCACGLWTCSAVLLALFFYATATLVQLTPTYEPVSCTHLPNSLGGTRFEGASVRITGYAQKRCQNPNSYPLHADEVVPGEVYAKTESGLKAIGVSHVLPVELEPGKETELKAELHISLATSDDEAFALLALPLVQVVGTLRTQASATISFLGVGQTSSLEMVDVCGIEVELSSRRVGPIVCLPLNGGNFSAIANALDIPSVDDDEVRTDLIEMEDDQIESATHKKNLSFGMIMAVFAFLALACFVGGIVAFRRARSASAAAREAKIQLETDEAQIAPEDKEVAV